MTANAAQKTFRRLMAAEGYLQLDLPAYALDELDAIEDAGPFEPPMHFMRGEALRAQERYEDAIGPLQQAAKMIPAPHNKHAWLALSDCLRRGGQDMMADVAETFANSPPLVKPVLHVNVTIQQPPAPPTDELPLDDDLASPEN